MKHQKSEKIIVKRITNFSKKIKETRYKCPSLYSTNFRTNSNITLNSLSPRSIHNNTERDNFLTIKNNNSINKKIENFMNKTIIIKKKIEEKDIPIFFFLKSTHHTEIKPKKKKISIENIKKRFTGSRLESLNSINNKIKRRIENSIVKKHLSELNINNNNELNDIKINDYDSDRNNEEKQILDILNKKTFLYNKNNFPLKKIHPHFSKRSQIGAFSPFFCTPSIMKDNSLMVRIFKQNLNYQKNSIKRRFSDKLGLLECI